MKRRILREPVGLTAGLCVGLLLSACGPSDLPTQQQVDVQFQLEPGDPGTVTLCKYTVEPTEQTFDFDVEADVGRVPGNGSFTLNATQSTTIEPECAVVWETQGDGAGTVTITEDAPMGWEVYRIRVSGIGDVPVETASTTVDVDESSTILVLFKNRPTDIDMAPGRMTGGGGQFTVDDVYVTRGFTIHCDITLSNNVEVNWPDGNQWHIDKPLTSAVCIDDPMVDPAPPPAPFDTFIGEGIGRLNGVDGSFIRFIFVDSGEPGGKNDSAEISIWAPGADPDIDAPVLFVDGLLDHGNIQAHYDQPHK